MSIRMTMSVAVLAGVMAAGLAACKHETKVYNEPAPANTSNSTNTERRTTTDSSRDMDNGTKTETHTETSVEHR